MEKIRRWVIVLVKHRNAAIPKRTAAFLKIFYSVYTVIAAKSFHLNGRKALLRQTPLHIRLFFFFVDSHCAIRVKVVPFAVHGLPSGEYFSILVAEPLSGIILFPAVHRGRVY